MHPDIVSAAQTVQIDYAAPTDVVWLDNSYQERRMPLVPLPDDRTGSLRRSLTDAAPRAQDLSCTNRSIMAHAIVNKSTVIAGMADSGGVTPVGFTSFRLQSFIHAGKLTNVMIADGIFVGDQCRHQGYGYGLLEAFVSQCSAYIAASVDEARRQGLGVTLPVVQCGWKSSGGSALRRMLGEDFDDVFLRHRSLRGHIEPTG